MKTRTLTRSLLLFISLLLAPLSTTASPLPEYPFVYVNGTANLEVVPDKGLITFRVKTYHSEATVAYGKQAEVADAFLAFAGKLGVPIEDIVAQAIEKSTVRKEDDKGKELEIIGYELVRSVQIELKDLARFSKLIDFLYGLPNVEGLHVTFGCKDENMIMQGLTDDACRTARTNAERLCQGFGKKIGAVRAISETGFSNIGSPFGFRGEPDGYGASSGLGGRREFPVIPATISFRKWVFAIFAIE